MKKQKVHCYSCDLDITVTVTEKDFRDEVIYCPFCSIEFMTDDEIEEEIGYDDE